VKKIFIFLLLISCASPNSDFNVSNKILDFNKDLSFSEFNDLLIEYAKINPYPDIDK
jgi:hypothetical protein